MENQIIITVGREFGSGGHAVAEELAGLYGIKIYDRNILKEIAKNKNVDYDELKKYDELPTNHFLYRSVSGFSNAPQDVIADMEFKFIKEKAQAGESFVLVGRCGEYVLKDFDCVTSVFITAKKEDRIRRLELVRDMLEEEAKENMEHIDKKRKHYHDRFSNAKWGEASTYDICISTTNLGIKATAKVLKDYIDEKSL